MPLDAATTTTEPDIDPYLLALCRTIAASGQIPDSPEALCTRLQIEHARAQQRVSEIIYGTSDFAREARRLLTVSIYERIRAEQAATPYLPSWNPRYVAFAASNGRTPEEQSAADAAKPLSRNLEFILWSHRNPATAG